jgi:hypothetical protein
MKRASIFEFPLALICLVSVATAVARIFRQHDLVSIGDWFALWSAPVIARSSGAVFLYDMPRLHAAQVALGLASDRFGPFPYPPTFLAILWPLGAFSIGEAFVAFMAVSFVSYLVASTGSRWAVPFAAFNPASVTNFLAGQSGFLSGGLMLGASRLIAKYPVVAGALFSLLTYKPQLGIMVPIALLASRQWTCIASATVATVAIIATTSWRFGTEAWVACWQSLGDYASASDTMRQIDTLSPTVSAMLRSMGTSHDVALGCQVLVGIVSAVAVWMCWRQLDPRNSQPAILALCAATFLATPHALFYDLTMLSGALLLYASHRRPLLSAWEAALILIGIALPTIQIVANVSPFVLAAILWMACTCQNRRPWPQRTAPKTGYHRTCEPSSGSVELLGRH